MGGAVTGRERTLEAILMIDGVKGAGKGRFESVSGALRSRLLF